MNIDWAVVFATLTGPVLAVWASEWRQRMRAVQERKEWVFRTLISTKAARLRIEHVTALNQIDFAFPRLSCPAVQDAWGLYRQHLRSPDSSTEGPIRQAWLNKANDLLDELLYQMAVNLKLPFSRTEVAASSYFPDAYALEEIDQRNARKLLLQVLNEGRPINIRVIDTATGPTPAATAPRA